MKCCVEYAYLFDAWEDFFHCFDTCHIGWVMEWSEVVAFFDLVDDIVGEKHAFTEFLGTVDYTVTYGVDFII